MHWRQLAVELGLEAAPAKVEGVRSEAKRPVTRGRLTEAFTMVAGRASSS
ncbi:hypothetical protein [Streptomyces rubrogriseus]